MPENANVTLAVFPMWTVWIVIILHAALVIAIGLMFVHVTGIITQIKDMLKDVQRDTMPQVNATLKNVESISADAAKTTHNVTTTADNVTGLVNNVVNKVESPLVRVAGLFAGVMAGAKAAKGGKGRKGK